MNIKQFFVLGMFLLLNIGVSAQTLPSDVAREDEPKENNKKFDKSRLFTGGGLGFGFGNVTYVEVSPLLGYRFTDRYSAGAAFTYQYYKNNNFDRQFTVTGPRIFNRFNVFENLFAQAEYERLTYKEGDFRSSQSRLPVGGGYQTRLGGNSFFTIIGMYDLLYRSNNGLYNSPWVLRGGVNIGF